MSFYRPRQPLKMRRRGRISASARTSSLPLPCPPRSLAPSFMSARTGCVRADPSTSARTWRRRANASVGTSSFPPPCPLRSLTPSRTGCGQATSARIPARPLPAGKEKKKFGFRFLIPKLPRLRGRSHEKKKVFSA
jgi:hypothetical protein